MGTQRSKEKPLQPPAIADRVLEFFCKDEWVEPIKGDVHEQYLTDRKSKGKLRADFNYWIHIINFMRPFALKHNMNRSKSFALVQNNIKTSWRILKRQKLYTSINLIGLIMGIAVCMNVGLFVSEEVSYDTFHPGYENIFRICASIKSGGIVYNEAATQFPLAKAFEIDYSGVEYITRVYRPLQDPLIIHENRKYSEDRFYFVDDSFFDVFGYELINGKPEEALKNPNSIVITEHMAKKYFGDKDPMGKIISYNDSHSLKVTGVVKTTNRNAHFKFDFLSPLQLQLGIWQEQTGSEGRENKWYWTGAWTYVKFKNKQVQEYVSSDLGNFVQKYFPQKWKSDSKLTLQRIDKIHLTSNLLAEIEPNGSTTNVRIFSIVSIILLSIAIVNFVNLMIAQSIDRSKQIAISKTLGATKSNIIGQVITETILICLFAGIVAVMISYFSVPFLNAIANKSMSLAQHLTMANTAIYFLFLLLLGCIAGLYPAIYLTRFNLNQNVQSSFKSIGQGSFIKELLVGLQFISSVVLIISMLTINAQRKYLISRNLGFDKENILVIKAREEYNENFEAFKAEVMKNPEVLSITGVWDVPGEGMNSSRFVPEKVSRSQPVLLPYTATGHDFIQTANVELVEGRYFDKSYPSDQNNAFILNEEAVKQLGWQTNPLGKTLEVFGPGTEEIKKKGQIIGVIKNYNFESMHHPIKPAVFDLTSNFEYFLVKFKTSNYPEFLTTLESAWVEIGKKWPMEYHLLDQRLESHYNREEKLSQLINMAVAVALTIACIGIFGLSSYMISRRTKEVGIRKILGSKTGALILLLSKKFITIVLVANVLAWPLSYLLMSKWLNNFQYAVAIGWSFFLLAFGITLMAAFGITSYHANKISRSNPINSLRYE